MTIQFYDTPENLIAGTTLKDPNQALNGNLALHTGEDASLVIANRQVLAEALQVDVAQFAFANQTHSKKAYHVKSGDRGRGSLSAEDAVDDVDALYTYESDVVVGVFTADCVPVIFYDEDTGLIGAIHSGWKGTVQDIVSWTFAQIKGQDPDLFMGKMKAIFGPSIAQDSFEVDKDVADQFKALGYADDFIQWDARREKYLIDNQATVAEQLKRVGFLPENIQLSDQDTLKMTDGFSYRLDKTPGRHFNFITRKG
ncbi:purine-nucleoside/S-methyl-5'-thioadenosine phosphorylase / adenosine deaminase [Aerococcus sp. 150760007-1]|uniref:Purine nucleoside phosphorylase n=1 Tax=Aerococcus urinaeequi TaxID=51665 RepID=A0ABR5ZZB8_9LACT|nr:peptidoglycan editing factor PgeF [Aerococcus urinaeequi]MBA5747083.1 peptidoglycan editing factor PgeF [Aerococcus urinaeequi]MBA5829867.1 peptidoglycan editing factor PgeF [Aerococcus urinaeequi]MBA5860475.1 peptidoglycan editing factor PgeF [Aerococcus urinaeequi]